MSDVGRVKGSQERGGETPPKGGARTIIVRKGETARQLYDRMYPETPLPDKGLRYFIAYFLQTRKDLPAPGDALEVPPHEKLFKIGTHADPETIALATKLAGEKGNLTHLSEIRRAASLQSKGLEPQATALALAKPQ
ncbi:MAG: hypothetical protein HYZ27_01755, partial [Deltaproteobacteria bacterium]|nr:hypothetical protein [Deltaproteobacteria bacterium]